MVRLGTKAALSSSFFLSLITQPFYAGPLLANVFSTHTPPHPQICSLYTPHTPCFCMYTIIHTLLVFVYWLFLLLLLNQFSLRSENTIQSD